MDRAVSLEVNFERLDTKKDIRGMWDLITMPVDIDKWPDDANGWIPTQYAETLAMCVSRAPSGWFTEVDRLDESFTHLVDLVGFHGCKNVKFVDCKDHLINGKTGLMKGVFVREGKLRVRVILDSKLSIMVHPKNLLAMITS